MASSPVHGVLQKQGPLATFSNFVHGEEDRLMFNGHQFVSLSAQSPKVVVASARRTIGFDSRSEIKFAAYNNFMDLDGNFRFVNGSPTLDSNIYTGWPGTYDHIVIGYDAMVSTATIKFWSKRYVDSTHVSIDYGYDSINFHPISGISVSWEFDDTIRHKPSEEIPSGMYVYTVSLGDTYKAKYWRIKGFLVAVVKDKVSSDVNGKDVDITSTTNWPSSGSVYLYSSPAYESSSLSEASTRSTSYTQNVSTGTRNVIYDLKITAAHTSYFKSGYILINEEYFNASTNQTVTECLGFGYISPFLTGDYLLCSYTSPCYKGAVAYGNLPESVADYGVGPHGGVVSAKLHTFPDSVIYMTDATYSSKNSTDLVNLQTRGYDDSTDLLAGTIVQTQVSLDIAQVQIKEEVSPLLRFWETDGSECVTKEVDIDNAYDVVYDKADRVYYSAEYSSTGGSGYGLSDDFSSGDTSNTFDSNRWTSIGSSMYRDDISECAVFKNTVSGTTNSASLITNGYHDLSIDYTDTLSVNITTMSGTVGYLGLVAKDKSTNNQINGVYVLGDWSPIAMSSFVGVEMYGLTNASDGDVDLRNFRFDPRNLPEDLCEHKLLFEDDAWKYSRTSQETVPTVSDIVDLDIGGESNIVEDGFIATLDKNPDTKDGSYISFFTNSTLYSPSASSNVELKLKYTSSSNILEAGANDGSDHYLTNSNPEGSNLKSEIVCYTDNYTTVSSTGFYTTDEGSMDIPCIRVRAFDNDGNITTVDGVTDGNGAVLSSLDVLRNYGVSYGDYYGKVSIATTGQSESIGGSIFIKVDQDLYKYNKTTLPITHYEDGSNAVVLASGIVHEDEVYNFSYNEFTLGGLSYLVYDQAREGVFMKVVADNTLQLTSYETELNMSSVTKPTAWDIDDMDTLYVVDSSNLYAYNTDETSVAFANVYVADTVLPANSSAKTMITAYATNLYGIPLENKTVYFAITSGGGSLSAASACTTSSGTASVEFTSATVSGTSIISVTASNDAC